MRERQQSATALALQQRPHWKGKNRSNEQGLICQWVDWSMPATQSVHSGYHFVIISGRAQMTTKHGSNWMQLVAWFIAKVCIILRTTNESTWPDLTGHRFADSARVAKLPGVVAWCMGIGAIGKVQEAGRIDPPWFSTDKKYQPQTCSVYFYVFVV